MALESGKLDVINFFNSVEVPFKKTGTSSINPSGYDVLTLQVSGSISSVIQIEACVNPYDTNGQKKAETNMVWSPLGIINAKTFKLVTGNTITEDGIYYIGVESVPMMRVNVTANSGDLVITGVLR